MANLKVSAKVSDRQFFERDGKDLRRDPGRSPTLAGQRIGRLRPDKDGHYTGYVFNGDQVDPNNPDRITKLGTDIDLRTRVDPLGFEHGLEFERMLRQAPDAVHDAKLYALARIEQITGLSLELGQFQAITFARNRALETYGGLKKMNEPVAWSLVIEKAMPKTPAETEKLVSGSFDGKTRGDLIVTLSLDDSHQGGAPDCPHVGWEVLFKPDGGGKRQSGGHVFLDVVHASRPNAEEPARPQAVDDNMREKTMTEGTRL